MIFAIYGMISLLVCWKWGDWRNWRLYYPTILYFMMGSLVYDFLSFNKPLWLYDGVIGKYTVLSAGIMFFTYPSTAILFLTKFPVRLHLQILRIVIWAVLFTAVEILSCLLLDFQHLNGWNMYYTFLFDIIMFALLRLHHSKPLLALSISAALAFLVLWWFAIPWAR